MNLSPELVVAAIGYIISIGVFIGMLKTGQTHTREGLTRIEAQNQRIEDKLDKQHEDIAELRERLAIVENVLEIKKK